MRQYLAWTILIALFAVGCNPQPLPVEPTPIPTLPPATVPPEPTAAPATSSEVDVPESSTANELIDAGAGVFDTSCVVCHNLTSEAKVGPGLAGMFEKESLPNGETVNDENLKEWILNGGGAMPGIPLADEQLEALIAFLKDATQ